MKIGGCMVTGAVPGYPVLLYFSEQEFLPWYPPVTGCQDTCVASLRYPGIRTRFLAGMGTPARAATRVLRGLSVGIPRTMKNFLHGYPFYADWWKELPPYLP
eukprot:1463785-Rhodomonas_salina.1